jgi:pimeloyl-ACP methyl ester carboxylesterase
MSLTNETVAKQIHEALRPLNILPADGDLPGEPTIGSMRRRGRSSADDHVGVVTLLDVDGVLLWEDGAVSASTAVARRFRNVRGGGIDGEVVTQLKYEKPLGMSSIVEKLYALDGQLTPRADNDKTPGSALLEYDANWTATPDAVPVADGPILLLVHGTFSSTENMVAELLKTPDFAAKMRAAGYKQVLGYDHFTVSRTPIVNAADLARRFSQTDAEIHIVCHSRGGLVARWFCEMLDRKPHRARRVVFVGCPLQGTSLADPHSLRHGLNLMTNVGKILGDSFALVPFLTAASGLVQILSSVTNVAARTPLVDAGIGLLPGIAAMSRIQKHAELSTLNHGDAMHRENYFAVSSNFKTEAAGWKFWRMFNKLAAADAATDYLVFEQDNDLVVDTSSMTYHAFGPSPDFSNDKTFCVFDEKCQVHHTAYFRQPKTLEFIAQSFAF